MPHEQNIRMQIEQHARLVEVLQDLLKEDTGSFERVDGWQQEIQWHGEQMLELQQSLQQERNGEHETRNRVVQRHSLL